MNTAEWIEQARQELLAMNIAELQQSGILPDDGKKFFPVIGYPPLTMFRDMNEGPVFEGFQNRSPSPLSAYVHIPFCPTRCTFCHWITKTRSKHDEVDVYIDHLEREMELFKSKMGLQRIPIKSVLFGGGTPTYPDARQLERLMQAFHRHFDLSECTQFSVEAEPTTLLDDEGWARLQVLKDYGVDRISLGVQSFDDDVLKYMARAHDSTQAFQAIELIRKAGIPVVFIDLIYGYPDQHVDDWARNMLQAVNHDIDGYQLYRLRIKQHGDRQGSIIKHFNNHPERFADVDDILLMKNLGILISEQHGYGEHQTRIFSKKVENISHYLRDWCCGLHDVSGVGVSSWTNLRGVFAQNIGDHDLANYYAYIDRGQVAIDRGKVRTTDDELRRCFILPLKNTQVDKSFYRQRTGVHAEQVFAKELTHLKQLDLIEETEQYIRMTKRGRFFADEVSTQFFNPLYMPFTEVKKITDADKTLSAQSTV